VGRQHENKEIAAMMLPKNISGWCKWLFFLFFGLGAVMPDFFVTLAFWNMLTGLFALVYAIAALFGK
jgi:hypothetical protein